MNQLVRTSFLIFILAFIIACDDKKEIRNPEYLEVVEISIPKELIYNVDAVEFFKSSEKAINKFSDNIEKIAFDGKDVLSKDLENLSSTDKEKLSLMAVQFVSNSTQMTNVLEETNKYIENEKKYGIDESQLKSMELIKDILEN
jgi:hypothetical protein